MISDARRQFGRGWILVVAMVALGVPARVTAQEGDSRPRVYVDCQGFACDKEFLEAEVGFVDYVRDRQDADVYVLVTVESTGGEGTKYSFAFDGQRGFKGIQQQLRVEVVSNSAADVTRRTLAKTLTLGLVTYAARFPVAEELQVVHTPAIAGPSRQHDRWNWWVIRTGLNGFFNGQRSTRFVSVSAMVSATRITEWWKIQLSTNAAHRENTFELAPEVVFSSASAGYSADALIAKSAGSHWSAGIRAGIGSSTFLNQDRTFRVAPTVEYNVFPYNESTRRQLTLEYATGLTSFDYSQTTIFDRQSEQLLDQTLTLALTLRQRWGSISTAVEGSSYWRDLGSNRVVLFTDVDLHLAKGIALNVNGSVQRIRDQIYLPQRSPSFEAILVGEQQLPTSHQYAFSIGLSYTFGSIYNAVVNSRFAGSRGGLIQTF